jgi:NAD(P)-dependent dehydrogenase (short-subunit alcohol dehydrogenase family)
MSNVVVVGGTRGLGFEVAKHYADRGDDVVLTGRDPAAAAAVAAELGGKATGIGLDLARPTEIGAALSGVGPVDHLVLVAIERDQNTVKSYDIAQALHLVTLKLVGYTEAIHALHERISPDGSILLFGGQAKARPYPGSATVSTVNGGIEAMVTMLALELAPVRVNAIHPGIVGDSPYWRSRPPEVLEAVRARTPTGRLVAMRDIVGAVTFLLENPSVNGANLPVDGGWLLM